MNSNREVLRGLLPQCHKLFLCLWPIQDQVSESNQCRLCQSYHVQIIVIFGHDESHLRICFLWLHIVLKICVVAFYIFHFCLSFQSESVSFESCSPCTMFAVALEDSCPYSIYRSLVFKPLVASISSCVKRMIANMLATFLCGSESGADWVHPSLTYLMAGFWWRPVAQTEKFSVSKWNVLLSLQSRKIGGCSILIPASISDGTDSGISGPSIVWCLSTFQLPRHRMNINWQKRCT